MEVVRLSWRQLPCMCDCPHMDTVRKTQLEWKEEAPVLGVAGAPTPPLPPCFPPLFSSLSSPFI